jgi:hypothetical protein
VSAWETFRRSVRRNLRSLGWALASPTGRIADEAIAGWGRVLILGEQAVADRDAAERERQYALADRDKAIRQRDAFAVEVDELKSDLAEMRRDRNLARSLVAASPEEAKRVCLDLSDRNAELRRDFNDLEKRFAELKRAAEPFGVSAP